MKHSITVELTYTAELPDGENPEQVELLLKCVQGAVNYSKGDIWNDFAMKLYEYSKSKGLKTAWKKVQDGPTKGQDRVGWVDAWVVPGVPAIVPVISSVKLEDEKEEEIDPELLARIFPSEEDKPVGRNKYKMETHLTLAQLGAMSCSGSECNPNNRCASCVARFVNQC